MQICTLYVNTELYMDSQLRRSPFNIIVIVAALGYFVDIYDLIIFGIVKNPSLMDLGITSKEALFTQGNYILRMQMFGMLLGGIVWGILGDKKGRLSTLFATILMYSLANIANGFVQNVEQYAWLRFIAGFGLSGELGIGITLVSEVMSKETRAKGAGIVSGIGIIGAALAFAVAEWLNWRAAYWFGGGLGLLLLVLRVAVHESGMFENAKKTEIEKGNFLKFFVSPSRSLKYFLIILVGIPTWYTVSALVINSSSFAEDAIQILGEVKGSVSVMLHYVGAAMGSMLFGYLATVMYSRKRTLYVAVGSMGLLTLVYFFMFGAPAWAFYTLIFVLGIPMGGLWAIFIAVSSELFGTNIRATITTTVSNFVRGAVVLITLLLDYLSPVVGLWIAGFSIGMVFLILSLISIAYTEETYGKDLDYIEKM